MNINDFQASMKFGGARTSLFRVRINNPVSGLGNFDIPFKCHAAQLPGRTQNPLPIGYYGRQVKFSSVAQFDDWTVQIYNDEDFLIRNDLEQWMNAINDRVENVRRPGLANPLSYKADATIEQLSKTNQVVRTYRMVGLFPINIAPVEMSWDADQIHSTSVTFSVDYYDVDDGTTGIFRNVATEVLGNL